MIVTDAKVKTMTPRNTYTTYTVYALKMKMLTAGEET